MALFNDPKNSTEKAQDPKPTAALQPEPLKVEVVTAKSSGVTPEQAAPDATDPSKFPHDGTLMGGLVGGLHDNKLAGVEVSPAVLNGNPPAYDKENQPSVTIEEPAATAGRLPVHMKLKDFAIGKNCYKLGVSHDPYVIEAGDGKSYAVLRAATGGTVHIANDDEASYFTLDQKRQYAVADGTPNVSGDVKHP